MKNIVIFALMAALLALSSGAVQNQQVRVLLASQSPDPVEPGDSVDLRFRFENNGSATVDGIQVELVPKYPLTISEPSVKDIGSLDAKQKGADAVVVKYAVQVAEGIDDGSYGIFLNYRIGSGIWMRAGPFNVDVKAAEAILGISSVETPESFSAGGLGNVDVALRNFGKAAVKDVRVRIDLDNVPFAPAGTSNEKVIDSIPAGSEASAGFSLIADTDAKAAYYKARITLDYIDDSGTAHIRNSTIGLFVYNEPKFALALKEAKVFTPNSNGEVVLSVSNTGPADIRFMTLELVETPEYRVVSSPSVYVGNLEADDFETASFDIRTGNVRPGSVSLNARLSYSDNLNREIVRNEVVKLQLYSKSDAKRFGLIKKSSNFALTYLSVGIQIITVVFLISMLIDCWKNSLPKYRKALWTVVILTGVGAVLYYFLARRKK